MTVVWKAVLRDEANYVQTSVEVSATSQEGFHLFEFISVDVRWPKCKSSGNVQGDLVR